MASVAPVVETTLADLQLLRRGKVRDVYAIDDDRLLIVATDRISAFDSVSPTPILRKGEVLTALSRFWFEKLGHIVPNHLLTTDINQMPDVVRDHARDVRGRSMLVRRTEVFPVECVVRGYLSGSGWKDYQRTGQVCGHQLPAGLRESEKLARPKHPLTSNTCATISNISIGTSSRPRQLYHPKLPRPPLLATWKRMNYW